MPQELLDYLQESYFTPLYLFTWIIAVITYKKYYHTVLKYFPVYIMYTFFTELLGYLIKHTDQFQFFSDVQYAWHNVIIYNIYAIVTFSFFYYIYWRVLKSDKNKKLVKYAAISALSGYVINLLFQNPFHTGFYWADSFASLALLFSIGLYFLEKRKEDSYYTLRHSLLFWISLGLFIFYTFFPFIFIAAYDLPLIYYKFHLDSFLKALIILMYSLFNIGFIVSKKQSFR